MAKGDIEGGTARFINRLTGNKDYAKDNGSYGLTSLRSRHVAVARSELRFNFKGKSGKTWRLQVKNPRGARVVKACRELPGQHLFQYIDADSESRAVTSSDVNDYLREHRYYRKRLPYLGRNCAGGDGTLGI